MRIAICDDEKSYIEKIKKDIKSFQTHENEFEFSEFESGEEFIAEFSNDKYDLLILDERSKWFTDGRVYKTT